MFRKFVSFLCLSLLAISMGGCPTVPQDQAGDAGNPTQVTDELRAACPGSTDAEIRTALILMVEDHENGWTKEEELEIAFNGCLGSSCVTCFVTMIDQVWGRDGN